MTLNQRQEEIIRAKESKIVVEACPACGKTAVLTERVRYLVKSGVNPYGIVAITFTNSAASEMRERLGEDGRGVFIGTVHGYANYLLYSQDINTINLLEKEEFDELFNMVKEHKECLQPVEHLLLDEAQDSTAQQYEFLLDIINPKNFFLVGDPRQAIYVWANADPDYFLDLKDNPEVTCYYLNQNYRNGRAILGFAKSLILLAGNRYKDNSVPMQKKEGRVINVDYSITAICRTFKREQNYKDWFVLCRTNEELGILGREFEMRDIPFVMVKRAEVNKEDLIKTLAEDKIKLMTIHASKGLESPNVMVIGAKYYNKEEVCISYVGATRAKDTLIWVRSPKTKQRKVQSWE